MKKKGLDARAYNKVLYAFMFTTVGITVLVSVYFVLILNKTSQDLSNNKYTAAKNNEKIEALANLKTEYKNIDYERTQLEDYIPDKKEASNIIKDIETMAQKNTLSFLVYQIDSTKSKNAAEAKSDADDPQLKKGDDYYTFTFKIELNGSYMMVDKMITDIESHYRLLEIKKISYAPQSKTEVSTGDNIKATLLINAYLRK